MLILLCGIEKAWKIERKRKTERKEKEREEGDPLILITVVLLPN